MQLRIFWQTGEQLNIDFSQDKFYGLYLSQYNCDYFCTEWNLVLCQTMK